MKVSESQAEELRLDSVEKKKTLNFSCTKEHLRYISLTIVYKAILELEMRKGRNQS